MSRERYLILNTDDVRLTDIENLRRHAGVAQLVLTDHEAYFIGVKAPLVPGVHRRGIDVNIGETDRPSTKSVVNVAIPHRRGI